MKPTQSDDSAYRSGVGMLLFNVESRVWVGQRHDIPGAWQMPQGGIDKGESPREAAFRELREEVGTDRAEIVAESARWLRYDLPRGLAGRAWRGRYRGQRQKWFAMRFLGDDRDIDLNLHHPEFCAWQWVDMDALPSLVIPFKRAVYRQVVAEFRDCVVSGEV